MTGSHIRGGESAGSKVILITREQIDASGYGRVEDVLATVTQNFNRANASVSEPGFFNLNRGAEVQLRGLGVGSTLTLVNGQRQGASGYQGTFTDISTIPVAAIDRIEMLPEGSAALYGSDAIGGVVNIILRRNFEGIEASLRGSGTDSGAAEREAALIAGHAGSWGSLLGGIQYNDSDALRCSERAYCATNGDLRPLGGTDWRGVASNPGTILGADTYAIPHGQDGTHLTAAQLIPGTVNHTDNLTNNDILPRQSMRSVFLSGTYKMAPAFELSADARHSRRDFRFTFPVPPDDFLVPVTNAFNHLGRPVTVAYDFSRDLGPANDSGPTESTFVSASLKRVLPEGWQVAVGGAYARASAEFIESDFTLNYGAIYTALASSDPKRALNLFGDGSHTNPAALDTLRSLTPATDDLNVFTATAASIIADGPIFSSRPGSVRLAVGGEFRHEHSNGVNISENPENRSRLVRSGFFELSVPLLPAREDIVGERLRVSLAARYDSYSDAGGTFNPKVGLSWRPVTFAKLRANWGTSFRAPPFFWSNRDQVGDAGITDVIDPRSPTGYTHALALFGPASDLKPETARAWTAGLDLLDATPDLSLSLTYFDVDYRGKIQHPGPDTVFYLTQETQLATLITRNPTPAQIAAVCIKTPLFGGSCNQPIDVIIDGRFRNLSELRTRGVDADLNYVLHTARGNVGAGVSGTYTSNLTQRITRGSPAVKLVDTVGNPPSLRLVGNLSWSMRHWTLQSRVNYTGPYHDPGAVPGRRVDAWTTIDLNFGYRVEGGSGWLAHFESNLGLINVFDQRPPFIDHWDVLSGTYGYDTANATLRGRMISLQITKRWNP